MLGRIAAAAALIALAGCAGMESAGRNARTGEPPRVSNAPSPAVSAPAPGPTTATAPPPQAAPAEPAPSQSTPPPSAAAPPASAPALTPSPSAPPVASAPRSGEDETVVVPGARERQVQPPNGDPRSNAERMEDIRAWDRCVMRVQAAADADPLRPQLVTPEDYCRDTLGMANRNAVPASRLERRR